MPLLKTLPGVGDILAIVIDQEVGPIDRFLKWPSSRRRAGEAEERPCQSDGGGGPASLRGRGLGVEEGEALRRASCQPGLARAGISAVES